MGTIINNIVYVKVLSREDILCSHHNKMVIMCGRGWVNLIVVNMLENYIRVSNHYMIHLKVT